MSERETRYILNWQDGNHVPVDTDGDLHVDKTPMLSEGFGSWDMAARWMDELFRAGCTLPCMTLFTQQRPIGSGMNAWQTVIVREFSGPTTDLSQPDSSQEFEFDDGTED